MTDNQKNIISSTVPVLKENGVALTTHFYKRMFNHQSEKKVTESAEITSFYLYPADGGKVVPHIFGQFISIRLFLPELSLNQARQYSLSHIPTDEHYRISVKRERGLRLNTDGKISNYLHDHVEVGDLVDLTAPTGNFILNGDIEAPITFISGGVGLTPLMGMLPSLIEKNHDHPITWLHACRNQSVHAFRKQVNELTEIHPKFQEHIFYDNLTDKDREDGIIEGPLDIKNLPSLPKPPNTKYYICGPAGFIQKQHQDLLAMGVDKEAVYFEEFGPQLLQLN